MNKRSRRPLSSIALATLILASALTIQTTSCNAAQHMVLEAGQEAHNNDAGTTCNSNSHVAEYTNVRMVLQGTRHLQRYVDECDRTHSIQRQLYAMRLAGSLLCDVNSATDQVGGTAVAIYNRVAHMVENGEINTEAGVRMAQSALQAVAQEVESRIATARSADSLRTRVRILMPQEAEYHTVVGVGGAEPQQTRENAVGSYNALLRLCEQATGSNAGGEAERVNQGCQRFEEQVIGTDYMEDRRLNGLVRLRVQLEQQRHDLAAAETIRGPLKHLRRRFGVAVCERKIGKTIEGIEKVLKNNPIIQA